MRFSALRTTHTKLAALSRTLHSSAWFPHLPLALLLAAGGGWLLRADTGTGWAPLAASVLSGQALFDAALLPQLLVGIGMILIALGLIFRSRVAWVMALLLSATAMVSLVLGHAHRSHLLTVYFAALFLALLAARARFDRSSIAAATLFALTSVVLLLLYATFGAYYLGQEFRPPITNLATSLYYAVVTTSTVGYGDIVPQSTRAELFSISVIVLGVAVFATSLTAVVAPLVTRSLQRIVNRDFRRMRREDHFIVIGNTALAVNTWGELARRNQAVTRILREATPGASDDADVVIGDPGNIDVLKRAGAEKAAAVLAMLDDDSDNAFVVLAVRELQSPARTVVAVNDSRHLGRVRLVQPDVIIAPQILGGELAAMIACGEEVTSDFVMQRLLLQDAGGGGTGTHG